MSGLHVIWFREDLRVHDHAALRAACQATTRDGGEVMALFVLPSSAERDAFAGSAEGGLVFSALSDLADALAQRGAVLHLRYGDILEILSDLHIQHRIHSLDMHESRGPDAIDNAVEAWSMRAGVRFGRHLQYHPGQSPHANETWQITWERFMARPRHEAPDDIQSANVGIGTWPRENDHLSDGGRKLAIKTLRRIFGGGAEVTNLPSGRDAFTALEPHLKLGVVSLREVWQAAIGAHQQALKSGMDIRAASIASFLQLLPSFLDAHSDQKRAHHRGNRPARSGKSEEPGHQFSLGLGDSSG